MNNIDIVYLLIIFLVILFSMTIHEAMHAYSSFWLGDDTAKLLGRLSFNPIKHIDPVLTILMPLMLAIAGLPIFGGARPVPFNPTKLRFGEWGMAIVALSGPLANLLIAFLSFGILVLLSRGNYPILALRIFTLLVSINLGFFVFNMLPIPPLDGSRVLYVLAPDFFRNIMDKIERFGIIFVFFIIFISGSLLGTMMSSAINFFINIFNIIFNV